MAGEERPICGEMGDGFRTTDFTDGTDWGREVSVTGAGGFSMAVRGRRQRCIPVSLREALWRLR